MKLKKWMDSSLPAIIDTLTADIKCPLLINTEKGFNLASQKAVHAVVDDFLGILFPGCHGSGPMLERHLDDFYNVQLRSATSHLTEQIESAFRYQCTIDKCNDCTDCRERAEKSVIFLIEQLPSIRGILQLDIQAAYDGDPAAKSFMEIVLSYPCLQAIAIHRIAHQLYVKEAPLIPRVMSELAHSRTGIDIHPGAQIGPGFFVDHGTGVVIGETCVIGENVKIYQGVTLGALSFPKDEHGNPIKGVKRHPEVKDNVTIYAGATILGGETVVGEGAVIGGNVWLTHSVPARVKVYNHQPKPEIIANEQ